MSQQSVPRIGKNILLFEETIPLRFSCITNTGWPLVLSLWFIQKEGKIYCATQKDAKVIEYLKKNPKCAFEIAPDKPPYKGIRGRGKIKLREDIAVQTLESLIDKYLKNRNSKLAKFLLKNAKNEIAIEITFDKLFTWDYSERMKTCN